MIDSLAPKLGEVFPNYVLPELPLYLNAAISKIYRVGLGDPIQEHHGVSQVGLDILLGMVVGERPARRRFGFVEATQENKMVGLTPDKRDEDFLQSGAFGLLRPCRAVALIEAVDCLVEIELLL